MTRRETTTRQAATEELWDALGAVGLADVVAGVPGGPDTQIGWNSAGLSGGQARRLALARARLLRRCELTAADGPAGISEIMPFRPATLSAASR
jgi:ATP-binding cassette, subfamily C, bacterial CydC